MKKALPILIILAVAVGAGIWLMAKDDGDENQNTSATETPQPAQQETQSDPDAEHLKGANAGATLDATAQTSVTVTMRDFQFDPTILKIKKGTTVTWKNNGDNGHDVTLAGNSPKQFQGSSLLDNGETYEFIFNETGKYYYFCTPHSTQMRAIIEVVE